MKATLIKLTIALLIGALAALATYRATSRPSTDHSVRSVPDSPGPLF
jgi:hypothetical protein